MVRPSGRDLATLYLQPNLKAAILVQKACANSKTLIDPTVYGENASTEVDFSNALGVHIDAVVKDGNLKGLELMLVSQAFSLDALFFRLSNMSMQQTDRPNILALTGLAIRAQGACRATIETLATIKNPPSIALVRQANIAGLLQVNNGQPVPPRAEEIANMPNKLMEVPPHEPKWLDAGAPTAHATNDPTVEAMDIVDRPKVQRGKVQSREKRLQGGSTSSPAPVRSRDPRPPRRSPVAVRTGETVPPVMSIGTGRDPHGS